jgi:hypothetical protein
MAQQETEHLTRIMTSAALSRAVNTAKPLDQPQGRAR